MTNYAKLVKGILWPFGGAIIAMVSYYMAEPLIAAGESFYPSTDFQGIIYAGLIILWVIMILILPSYYLISGLREHTEQPRMAQALMGLLILVFSVLITIKAYWMVIAFAEQLPYTLIYVIFLVSVAIMWLEITILTPAYLILNGLKPSP